MSDIPKRKRRTKQEIAAANAAAANAISAAISVATTVDISDITPLTELVQPKTRGKKKIQPVVAIVTSDGIQGSFDAFSKAPLIGHLDIRSADVIFYDQPFNYNPDTSDLLKDPEPYDAVNGDMFSTMAEPVENTDNVGIATVASVASVASVVAPVTTPLIARKEFGSQELLVSFASSRQTKMLPEKTDIYCFWCSHPFEGRPVVIPQACVESVWKVYGNFCCPSCALSYLMNQTMDTHLRWERIALLNRLYGASVGGRIYPAPARETLTAFGGSFSISEYRALIDDHRVRVDINYPPMVSILASMDTKPIDFYETSIKNTFATGGVADRFAKAEEGLKLRRTKPLKDRESTLDSCLNISIRASSEKVDRTEELAF